RDGRPRMKGVVSRFDRGRVPLSERAARDGSVRRVVAGWLDERLVGRGRLPAAMERCHLSGRCRGSVVFGRFVRRRGLVALLAGGMCAVLLVAAGAAGSRSGVAASQATAG